MKTTLLLMLAVAFVAAGCSDNRPTAQPSPTATPNLRADADRLQQAINKAAEQRKQQSAASPTASP